MKKKLTLTGLKNIIKKLVLQEITQGKYPIRSMDSYIESFGKALTSSVGKDAKAIANPYNSKISLVDGKDGDIFDVELYLISSNNFNLVCMKHGSDRKVKQNMTEEDVVEFIKKDLKDITDSYVQIAYKKSMAPYGKAAVKEEPTKKEIEKEKKEEEEVAKKDEMEETGDVQKQVDIKATEAPERKKEELIASTPGSVVDKIEKMIDKKVGPIIKPPKIEKSKKDLSVNFKSSKKGTSNGLSKSKSKKLTPKQK